MAFIARGYEFVAGLRPDRLRRGLHVRFGSLTDIEVPRPDVRLTPKADIAESDWHVRFVPIADIQTAIG